ncbi:MAG: sigma factor-like helix-turn-helix DNA-binding protein [Methanoregulaceae archaeon]|nr:sigma factor-like helix-turn-helix DNA-binding protein [Methanoregulaceae archaeon]
MSAQPTKSLNIPKVLDGEIVEKKYLMQKARSWLDFFFMDRFWSYELVENVKTYYWMDAELGEQWCQEAWELWVEKKLNSDEEFRAGFISETKAQFAERIKYLDPLSQLAAMNPYSTAYGDHLTFKDVSSYFFLKPFYEWCFGVVCGDPSSGKTDWACKVIEMAVQMGFAVVTNVELTVIPKGVTYANSLKKVLMVALDNLFAGKVTIAVLDELAQYFNKKQSMKKSFIDMEKLIFLFRKFGCNLISILQLPKDVPTVIEQFSSVYFQKLSREKLLFKRNVNEAFIIGEVPGTELKFLTRDPASFVIDVDVEALHGFVTSLKHGTNKLKAIREWLEMTVNQVTPQEEAIAMKVLWKKGMTQEEIAEIFGVSRPAISQRLSKMGVSKEELMVA